MSLASLPGKLGQYLAMPGVNTIELDVKDENGRVGFVPSAVPLARRIGAAGPFYRAKQAARLVHARRLPDRPRRHLRGPGAVGAAPGARDPDERRLALAEQLGPRLDEPLRPSRL